MIAPALVEATVEVQAVLSAAGIRSCVIGGLAVQRWGEPRATQDVDFSVLAPPGEEQRPLDLLLEAFTPRRADARAFAIANRVLLIQSTNKVAVDVGLAASPFEVEVLDRSSAWDFADGLSIVTCSAEDLVLYKLVAGRARDVADIEGIVRRQASVLDVERIRRFGVLFAELKEEPDLLRSFERSLARAQE
ncbi:MAG: hypothetical protein Q7R30_22790 [Acidobacteriota bacterium]|nr:hypothetical protein [Acidobacteriota bacterium]